MNEEIAHVEVAAAEEADLSSLYPSDSPAQSDESFLPDADADAISDARLYLVAMGALFSAPSSSEKKNAALRPAGER